MQIAHFLNVTTTLTGLRRDSKKVADAVKRGETVDLLEHGRLIGRVMPALAQAPAPAPLAVNPHAVIRAILARHEAEHGPFTPEAGPDIIAQDRAREAE